MKDFLPLDHNQYHPDEGIVVAKPHSAAHRYPCRSQFTVLFGRDPVLDLTTSPLPIALQTADQELTTGLHPNFFKLTAGALIAYGERDDRDIWHPQGVILQQSRESRWDLSVMGHIQTTGLPLPPAWPTPCGPSMATNLWNGISPESPQTCTLRESSE